MLPITLPMKGRRLAALLAAVALSTVVPAQESPNADDLEKALEDAGNFAQAGEFAKALERHEWFHRHALLIDQAYAGVRLSFALREWKKLADQYSPALESLKAIRDTTLAELLTEEGTLQNFRDVLGINRSLGEESATVSLFKQLHRDRPGLARECFPNVQDALVEADEIGLFKEYSGDLIAFMELQIKMYQAITTFTAARPTPETPSTLKAFDDSLVRTALRMIKVANRSGDAASAEKIREMTWKIVEDPRLKAGG